MSKIIVGYEFNDENDYKKAKEELEYINGLKSNPDFNNDSAYKLELYNTLIEKEKFKTPVGFEFLRELQKSLYKNSSVNRENVRSIPYRHILHSGRPDDKPEVRDNTKNYRNYLKYKDLYIKMLILNIVLIITVVAMIIISNTSKKFDADYYRESIENDYVNWDRDLTERESILNEKENGN